MFFPSSAPAGRRVRVSRIALSCIGFLIFALSVATSSLAHPGRWSNSVSWNPAGGNSYAIHMALVRGDGAPYHSRILWFRGQNTAGFQGGEWGWKPGSVDCATYPGSSFVALPIGPPGMDVFCSGHSSLGDGRIFVPGGTDPVTGHYGENETRIYTPGTDTIAGTWSTPPYMVDWRWYPTATTLPDGRVLTTGGNRHPQHRVFGGRRNGSPPAIPVADSVYRFAPVDGGAWEPAVLPALDPTENPGRPMVREGHTSVDMGIYSNWEGANVVFGGRRDNGTAIDDTWFLIRENPPTGADYTYRWARRAKTGPTPPVRGEHVAAPLAGSTMVVHGGRTDAGAGLLDTWILRWISGTNYQWSEVTTYGTAPSARFGHGGFVSKMAVKQADGSMQETSRLIVFGGTASVGSNPTDTQVYELRLDSTNPAVGGWRTMQVIDLGFGQPSPRHGHGFSRVEPEGEKRQHSSGKFANTAVLFGGQLGASSYSNEVWVLWAFDDSTVGWEKKTFGGTAPTERARAGVLLDFS